MHIVTGGAGFIGSAFVGKLNLEGIDDILIVDDLATSEKWKNFLGLSFKDYIHKDRFLNLLEKGTFKTQVSSMTHMGACSSTTEENSDYLLANNYRYSKTLAKHCFENSIRFIYASSAATYGDGSFGYSDKTEATHQLRPLNRYGYSKQLFDLWSLRKDHVDKMVGLKFFNVYGPNEYHKEDMCSVVNKAYHQIKEHDSVKLFRSYKNEYKDGEQKRDFVYIKDCIDVMWWFFSNPNINGIYNLGSGKARTWKDLVNATFAALGLESKIEYIEMPEILRKQYQYFSQADMHKLKEAGYSKDFHSLEDGVRDYVLNYLEKDNPYYPNDSDQ